MPINLKGEEMTMEVSAILQSINAGLLAIIVTGGGWGINKICNCIEKKVDKEDCEKAHHAIEKETGEVWDRVNHHQHNGGGRVVIS
jgi:hypothetical protein